MFMARSVLVYAQLRGVLELTRVIQDLVASITCAEWLAKCQQGSTIAVSPGVKRRQSIPKRDWSGIPVKVSYTARICVH